MNQQEEQLKQLVREKYAQIATQSKTQNETSACGCGSCGDSTIDYSIMADDYSNLQGYEAAADLGLGCGLPTEFAHIKAGDTVVDLGSGAGNDCFVARALTGAEGKVIGIDMTEKMIELARQNAQKLGFENVFFHLGDIDAMPLEAAIADVVVSNCVLNLVPNKTKVLSETYRILKKGGHFSISDIVLEGELPNGLQKEAEMYAGCVSGAIQKSDYLRIIAETGFQNISIQKEKVIQLPDALLSQFLDKEALAAFKSSSMGIYSITVYAEK
ncbi:MAG: methyltransferase domain-containing protein [Cytophagales bacterium]|nr:MAG: methyltransferase domain-containing protein [Cytophagales bacterium]